MMKTTCAHGGDPSLLEARFGCPENGWLDLSTGINPTAYPIANCPPEVLQRLPTQPDMDALLVAARTAYNVPDEAAIVASPGTQALLQQVPTIFEAGDVNIVSPTYGEHAPAWAAAGHTVTCVDHLRASSPYAVVVHPNNPDGKCQTVERILKTAEALAVKGGVLVVDEAFADVRTDVSVIPYAGEDGLIVLRSFGKFFGLAGVRLGFAICPQNIADALSAKMGPWAVSGPALWAGTHALQDQDWIAQSRRRLAHDRARLDELLHRVGCVPVGGTDLFRLVRSDRAETLYTKLAKHGVLVRIFQDHPTWLRFGLPGGESDWKRLENALGF